MKLLALLTSLSLAAGACAHDPAASAVPPPAEAPAAAPSSGLAGAGTKPLCGAPPPACGAAQVKTVAVSELLQRTVGGPVVVAGFLVEGEHRCTHSVPPSCASSLLVEQRQGQPGQKPRVWRVALGGGHGCSAAAGKPGCCTLPVGARVRVAGEHKVTTGRWGAQHELAATAVCALH